MRLVVTAVSARSIAETARLRTGLQRNNRVEAHSARSSQYSQQPASLLLGTAHVRPIYRLGGITQRAANPHPPSQKPVGHVHLRIIFHSCTRLRTISSEREPEQFFLGIETPSRVWSLFIIC